MPAISALQVCYNVDQSLFQTYALGKQHYAAGRNCELFVINLVPSFVWLLLIFIVTFLLLVRTRIYEDLFLLLSHILNVKNTFGEGKS